MYSNGVPSLVHTLVTLRGRPVVGALVLLKVVPTSNTSANVADSIPMVDDGRADPDLVAGDGIYSAYVFDHVGLIKLEVEVSGGLRPTSAFTFTLSFTFSFSFIFHVGRYIASVTSASTFWFQVSDGGGTAYTASGVSLLNSQPPKVLRSFFF